MIALGKALILGYKFHRASDADIRVKSPQGKAYIIIGGVCNCPDRRWNGGSHDGQCKHEIMCKELTRFLKEVTR